MNTQQIVLIISCVLVVATVGVSLYMTWRKNKSLDTKDILEALEAARKLLALAWEYAQKIVGWLEQQKKLQGLSNEQVKAMGLVTLKQMLEEKGVTPNSDMLDILIEAAVNALPHKS
jgi:hypothetical protein